MMLCDEIHIGVKSGWYRICWIRNVSYVDFEA